MAKPTHQDALVMLNLMQWAAMANLSEASRFVWGERFIEDFDEFVEKYPIGTEEYAYATLVSGYYETIGTLWKNDLLNEDLLFDWILVTPSWNRLKGFTLGLRESVGEEKLYENFEALSAAQK